MKSNHRMRCELCVQQVQWISHLYDGTLYCNGDGDDNDGDCNCDGGVNGDCDVDDDVNFYCDNDDDVNTDCDSNGGGDGDDE